jgi:hypothetical protein
MHPKRREKDQDQHSGHVFAYAGVPVCVDSPVPSVVAGRSGCDVGAKDASLVYAAEDILGGGLLFSRTDGT